VKNTERERVSERERERGKDRECEKGGERVIKSKGGMKKGGEIKNDNQNKFFIQFESN